MEAGIFNVINNAVNAGLLTDTALLLIVLGFLFFLYKNVLKPIVLRVNEVPTYSDVRKILADQKANDAMNLDVLTNRLEKIVEDLDEIEATSKISATNIRDLKRDLESIKQILNQFQGHLMYSQGGRGHWGNKELK